MTASTAATLLAQAPSVWREVLEKICLLVDEQGSLGGVLPTIDHGRVSFFVKFWSDVDPKPEWLSSVLECLRKYV